MMQAWDQLTDEEQGRAARPWLAPMPDTIDLRQLLLDCHAAEGRMGNKNSHKHLLLRVEMALMALWQERREHLREKAADARHTVA